MNKANFDINTCFENNTYYSFNDKVMHVYSQDAKLASSKKHLTVSESAQQNLGVATAFLLDNLNDITLDFCGATLVLHGKIQPFLLDNCKNLTIKNVTVEYDRSFFTELEIVKNTGDSLCAKIKPCFPCRVENGFFVPFSQTWEDKTLHIEKCHFIQAFNSQTGEGKGAIVAYIGKDIVMQSTPPSNNIQHVTVSQQDDTITFFGNFPKHWDSTMTIAIEHEPRDKCSVAMYHSSDVLLENYRILNGAAMGIYSVYCQNIKLDGLKLYRDAQSHGVITNSADAVHLIASKGTVEIVNSTIGGMIDDALNVHSNYYHSDGAKNNVIFARRSNASHALGAHAHVFDVGDKIAVYRGKTLSQKETFTVTNVKITGDWTLELEVDKDAGCVSHGDVIENLSTNPNLILKNNLFQKANTHLRIQTRAKSVIDSCSFDLPIMLTGDMNYWDEASPVCDLTIKNCSFLTDRATVKIIPEFTPTKDAPYYHSGVKIINNVFKRQDAISIRCAKDIVCDNNKTFDGLPVTLKSI